MAEGGGLFSGLKFTDIFFPAAATAASMYSPYAARGINTGLHMVNTFGQFQDSARKWKAYSAEQKLLKEQLEQGQRGTGEYLAPIEGRAGEIKRRWTDMIQDELDYPRGPEGATIASVPEPMSEEDFKKAMQESMTPGNEDKWALGVAPEQQAGLVGDPAGSFQEEMAASAPPRFTEAVPWYLEQEVDRALFDDPEYQALQREANLTKLMGARTPLSPGSTTSVLGYSALGSQDLAQEKQRMVENINLQDQYAENQFLREQELKKLETEEVRNRMEAYAELDTRKKENWVAAAGDLADRDPSRMNHKELFSLKNQTLRLIQQGESWGEAATKEMLAELYGQLEYINTLLPGGTDLSGGGAGTSAAVSSVTSDFTGQP